MRAKTAGIYVRVSLDSQNTAMQERELQECAESRGWEVKVYRDVGQSGTKQNRPALMALLADVRRRRIGVVMVWSLDRLARSLKHLLSLAEAFDSAGVDLYSHKQAIDTSSPMGKLTYQVLGAVAEFERELLRERVRSGMAEARKRGKQIGRPPRRQFATSDVERMRVLQKGGISVRRLALDFGTTQFTVCKLLKVSMAAQKGMVLGG